jgi:hypothetical protein
LLERSKLATIVRYVPHRKCIVGESRAVRVRRVRSIDLNRLIAFRFDQYCALAFFALAL